MKAVAGFALIAAVHAAGWQDTPVDPAKSTTTTAAESTWSDYDPPKSTTTTTKPAEETQSYWGDVPVDETTTTTATWSDYDPPKSTTTTTKPAEETETYWSDAPVPSETETHTWSDYPVEETTTTTATWADVSPAPVDPAKTWVDADVGSCKVVTVTKTGAWIWVPAPAEPTSADPTWSDFPVDETSTTTSADPTWSDYPVEETSTTTTVDPTWSDYTVAPTTTTSATWTKPTTLSTSTKATTTTSSTPKPTDAVCPNDNGKTLPVSGSCGGSFQINCGVKATPGAGSKFWQRQEGEKVPTLAACLAICNENALCESVLYVQEPKSSDDQLCWQTSGLGPVTGSGYAQIAYKSGAKGKCAQSYTK